MTSQAFLHQIDDDLVIHAIQEVESRTSGEIRVYVCSKVTTNPITTAWERFELLGMSKTDERSGILIFIAPNSQNFAIIGDEGIHRHCGEGFWKQAAQGMEAHLRQGHFTEALVTAIECLGQVLARYFPEKGNGRNELPDEIVRG